MLQKIEFLFILTLCFFAVKCNKEDGSLSVSVVGMIHLLETERLFLQQLGELAELLQQKYQLLNSTIEQMSARNQAALIDAERHLSNPINAFTLMRRMGYDAPKWLEFIKKPIGEEQLTALQSYKKRLPSVKDFEETIAGIKRLQSTYDISAEHMAAGLLDGVQYGCQLTSIDCYAIGAELARRQDYRSSIKWLYTSAMRFEKSPLNVVMNFSLLHIATMHSHALLMEREAAVESPALETPDIQGCRGAYNNRISNLYCRYNTTTTHFLKLAPLKMEIISLDPYMVLYHDIIYDTEIEELKAIVLPKLSRALVHYNETYLTVFEGRTAKLNWMEDYETDSLLRIHRRIHDMTGLNMHEAEQLQLMNYGLGGHYLSHMDAFLPDIQPGPQGDRIASLLIYFSDVEQGGLTVFSDLGISIKPVKGTALLWHNLDNRGNADLRLTHTGCPVLVGSKWVGAKWIRYNSQMLYMPCYKEN